MAVTRKTIGERIRDLRERQGLSREDLARRLADDDAPAEIAHQVELIEALEGGSHLPSVKILLQVSRALGKRLGHLTDDHVGDGVVVRRASELGGPQRVLGSNLGKTSDELAWYFLAADKPDRHMEPALIELQPRKDAPHVEAHEAEEFIYVVDGRLEIVHGTSSYELAAGDSIAYSAAIPHHVHAIGDRPAKIVAVFFGHMKNEPSVVRAAPRRRARRDRAGDVTPPENLAYYAAATWMPESIQSYVVEIGPDEIPRRDNRHEGEEFLYVLSGRIEFYYGKVKFELSAGDSAYYDSSVRHRLVRVGDAVARILSVMYNPA